MDEILREITRHGYITLFASVFARQLCVPVPAILFLLTAGAMAGNGKLNLAVVIILGALGCVLADLIWYEAGRLRGEAVVHFLQRFSAAGSGATRISNVFPKYGPSILLVSKFVIGLDALAPPVAGMVGVGWLRFLSFESAGATFWAVAYSGLGFLFCRQLSSVTAYVQRTGALMTGLLVLLIAIFIARRVLRWYRLLQELRLARITPEELRLAMQSGEPPVVLDVEGCAFRHPVQPQAIPGAIQIDGRQIQSYADVPIPPGWKKREIVLYCSCPYEITSARVALLLRKKGVERVRPLAGGLRGWIQSGYPVTASSRDNAATKSSSAKHSGDISGRMAG